VPVAILGHRFGKGLQLQLDLLQRVEGRRDHRFEHRVDDVSLAPVLPQIGGEDGGQ
jgi:hypothetical protein